MYKGICRLNEVLLNRELVIRLLQGLCTLLISVNVTYNFMRIYYAVISEIIALLLTRLHEYLHGFIFTRLYDYLHGFIVTYTIL
jgi:hypothetical protein